MSRKGIPNKKSKKILFNCKKCGVEWLDYPSRVGRKRYCSQSCSAKSRKDVLFRKGNKINLGKKYSEERKNNISIANKRAWSNPELRLRVSKDRQGNRNWQWKKEVTYSAVHKWLVKHYGSSINCEATNCSGISLRFEWALIKGKKHARNRKNYIQLCKKCHNIYDKAKINTITLPKEQK